LVSKDTHIRHTLLKISKRMFFSFIMAIKLFSRWQCFCTETRPECTVFQHFWSISEQDYGTSHNIFLERIWICEHTFYTIQDWGCTNSSCQIVQRYKAMQNWFQCCWLTVYASFGNCRLLTAFSKMLDFLKLSKYQKENSLLTSMPWNVVIMIFHVSH